MKHFFSTLLFTVILTLTNIISYAQSSFQSFEVGEKLKFQLHYGLLTGGYTTLEVKNGTYIDEEVYHIIGKGWSVGMFDWFFKVRDKYETYLHKDSIVPLFFIRDVYEDGYEIKRQVKFNRETSKAYVNNKAYKVPHNVQDLISAYYSLRNNDLSSIKVGDNIEVNVFLDLEVFTFQLRFLGRETITSNFGEIRCLKFRPFVLYGRIFKEEESLTIWVSDDKNRIPILASAEILFGSLKMKLIEYQGLKYDVNFINEHK